MPDLVLAFLVVVGTIVVGLALGWLVTKIWPPKGYWD